MKVFRDVTRVSKSLMVYAFVAATILPFFEFLKNMGYAWHALSFGIWNYLEKINLYIIDKFRSFTEAHNISSEIIASHLTPHYGI